MYDVMKSPIQIGGLTLKNRIVFAPTTLGLPDGEYFSKIGAIADSGIGLVIIGDISVEKSYGPSLLDQKGRDWFRRLTDRIHTGGAKAAAQLFCSDYTMTGFAILKQGVLSGKISQDDIRKHMNGQVECYITGMLSDRVEEILQHFGEAAIFAKQAGFDLIQIHGDRMCGSFSSPLFNKRTDRYGDSAENRARFSCSAVQAVRAAVPELPIDYKLAVRQENPSYGKAGVLLEELEVFVPLLEKAGVDSFHVTLGNHASLTDPIPPKGHPYFNQEGCFLPYADRVRSLTSLPVCGVGRLSNPDFIEAQLESGRIQLAAMSRQLIADSEWMQKTVSGDQDKIKKCIFCNRKCLEGMQSHKGVHCIWDEPI